MASKQLRLLSWLFIWTTTLLAWAIWGHWAPRWSRPKSPEIFERRDVTNKVYVSNSADWVLKSFDLEGFKGKLRSGRPIDTYVLSVLGFKVADLDSLTRATLPDMIKRLLDEKMLIKYRRLENLGGPEALSRETRTEVFTRIPSLSTSEMRRRNAGLLASWYPLEFEKFPPLPLQLFAATPQLVGFMDLKMRLKAQPEETSGVLFQTANGNRGIRVELQKTLAGTTALRVVVGNVHAKSGRNPRPGSALVMTTDLGPDQEHTLELHMDTWGSVNAHLDGVYAGEIRQQSPMVDNVILGNGYDGHQPFWGQIDLEHLTISSLAISSIEKYFQLSLNALLCLALAVSNLLSLYFLVRFLFLPIE